MTTPKAPLIGSRIRITENWPQGTRVIHEGIYTGWHEPDWELDGHLRVPFSAAGHCVNGGEGALLPDVVIEILSLPEPCNGTWLTTPNRQEGRPPYVFHRDDAAAAPLFPMAQNFRWYFHEDGDWITWSRVQEYGEITLLRHGAGAA